MWRPGHGRRRSIIGDLRFATDATVMRNATRGNVKLPEPD